MEVGLHANICDSLTEKISSALTNVFNKLSKNLAGDYGGIIEHLWIDFELVEYRDKPNGKSRFPFRFAKRVSGRGAFGLGSIPDYFNVGHFSVRPDYIHLVHLPIDEAVQYCLDLIYEQLTLLKVKEKRLGGFNSELFNNRFYEECFKLGYSLERKYSELQNHDSN